MAESGSEELNIEARRKKIVEMLHLEGKVKVIELSRQFGISEVTIRGDLDTLEREGLLERVHGGAISTYKKYYSMNFHDRMETNQEEKRKIAVETASLISDGDTIILGSGTTPLFVLRELRDIKNLIVITNSLFVAEEAGFNKNIDVIVMLGGNINWQYKFTSGDDAISQLSRYKADKLILSSDGISAEFGVTTYHHLEAELNRQMIARVSKTIVVADHTKIGRTKFAHIVDMRKVDCLVTSRLANREELDAIAEQEVEVRVVP